MREININKLKERKKLGVNQYNVTGALLSEEGLALSKLGLTYVELKDVVRQDTLLSHGGM